MNHAHQLFKTKIVKNCKSHELLMFAINVHGAMEFIQMHTSLIYNNCGIFSKTMQFNNGVFSTECVIKNIFHQNKSHPISQGRL